MDTAYARTTPASEIGVRPPAKINGKRNPEYTRWYRHTNPEKVTRYNCSEKAKACRKRYYPKLKKLRHPEGQCTESQTKCIECQTIFDREEAKMRGVRFLKGNRGYRCVCNVCLEG